MAGPHQGHQVHWAKAGVLVSGVVAAPIELVWEVASRFTRFSDWVLPSHGVHARSRVMPGGPPEYTVGCVRIMSLGDNSYAERLLGMDSSEHLLRWELISIPGATNPFEGSFLNNRCTLELRPISLNDQTFVTWTADWETEPEAVTIMEAALEDWLANGIKGLNQFCAQKHLQEQALAQGSMQANGAPPQHAHASLQNAHSSLSAHSGTRWSS